MMKTWNYRCVSNESKKKKWTLAPLNQTVKKGLLCLNCALAAYGIHVEQLYTVCKIIFAYVFSHKFISNILCIVLWSWSRLAKDTGHWSIIHSKGFLIMILKSTHGESKKVVWYDYDLCLQQKLMHYFKRTPIADGSIRKLTSDSPCLCC